MATSLPTLPSFRFDMIGKEVLRVERDTEGVGVQLDGGWNIAVWAPCSVLCDSMKIGPTPDIDSLVGAKLKTFAGNSDSEKLVFDNGCVLQVDLKASAGSTAESMAVYGPNKLIVVWE